MKEKPILFSGPMVRAILEGRKTQTRIIKFADCVEFDERVDPPVAKQVKLRKPLPYQVGDVLWVRETWGAIDADHPLCEGGRKPQLGDRLVFRANPADDYQWSGGRQGQCGFVWRPSIHMPRWASRLSLRVTGVRVERLQDISGQDAWAEGVPCTAWHESDWDDDGFPTAVIKRFDRAREEYEDLWESIHGPGSWAENPWVAAYEFEVTE